MYKALDVAKYIINKCTIEKCPISNLQLQKILYFLQRDYLQKSKLPLFTDEIQAWQFGPVVPDVYYQYCGFGSMKISIQYDFTIGEDDKIRVDKIVIDKRQKDPWDLVRDTHNPDKAWALIYEDGRGDHAIIPTDLIAERG